MKEIIFWFEKHNKTSWFLTILFAIIIFLVSSLVFKIPPGSPGFGFKAVVYHFLVFFIFSFFLVISISRGKYRKGVIISLGISIIYAILDEFHQYFVPTRSCSLFDVLVDSVGCFLAVVIYVFISGIPNAN